MRSYDRTPDQERPVAIEPGFTCHADGSVLISMGNTRVICTAVLEDRVPGFLKGSGSGWVTAEYGMLPASTSTRMQREASRGKQGGRTVEIQRLIGRTLRVCVDYEALGERMIQVDCDVIQADGGTRTASITGACVALVLCLFKHRDLFERNPLVDMVSAISVGIVDGTVLVDLDYAEDSHADVDANLVVTKDGKFVEIQGTAEQRPFTPEQLQDILKLGGEAMGRLSQVQVAALKMAGVEEAFLP